MSKTFDKDIERLKQGVVYSQDEINKIIAEIKEQYPNTSIKRVCAYGRVSTKHEEQKSSLLTQHEVFKTYCEQHRKDGYVLVEEVYEQRSGTLITKRPKFKQMIEEAKAGRYDILMFKSSSRFSRNTTDFLDFVEDLKRQHIYLVFINDRVTTETADRQVLTMLGMMAESYSNSLHDSNSTAIRIRQNSELGRVPGNVFGYKRHKDNTSLADIVPEQADLIRELFNRYADGEGIASICKDWQERGIKTYNGGTMSMFALRRFIRNPLYKGVLEMGKFKKHDVRAERTRTPDEELIVRNRPDLIIVEPELWDYCNEIMDSNKRNLTEQGSFVKKTDTIKDKLFSKVIKCGECGRNYNRKESNHKDKNKRYIYLMCGYKKYNKLNQADQVVCHNEKVIRLDTLTEIVCMFLKDLIENQDSLKETVVSKITSIIEEMKLNSIDKQVEQNLKDAQAKLKRYVELYKDGLIDESEYREQRAEVKKLEKETKNLIIIDIDKKEIEQLADKFIQNIENIMKYEISDNSELNIKEFNKLFDNITVYSDHVDIVFKMLRDNRLNNIKSIEKIEKIDIKQVIPEEHRDLKFVCPVIDNKISKCKTVDKHIEPYSLEEKQYLDSIDDKELRNKIRKKLHRKKKTANQTSERTSEILGLNREAVINKHTNQVVSGLKDIDINVFIS